MTHLTSEQWEQVQQAFAHAQSIDLAQRAAYLAQLEQDSPVVSAEVRSLLAAREAAPDFLESSALDGLNAFPQPTQSDPMIGRLIGPYRLAERIAHGGMGTVYAAERTDEQFEHRVAVKLIRPGLSSDEIIARFRNERQVLANLTHPNIAQLYDGGSTDDGIPYLVMELIDGMRIDRYCDAGRLTIEQRIALFRMVCDAVQHAHQNLIVHRDLKPSNIFVTKDGTVKLLDFGIARVLEPDQEAAHDATVTAERRLTPAYASPEQIRREPVTTASDVYSLGVVLYELLTGRRPYSVGTASGHDMERAICEQPPTRPSTAVMQPVRDTAGQPSAPDATTRELIAASRGVNPARLGRLLRGDLETIVLTALNKEPSRRYASVQQFSDDLNRYLRHEPIIARRPSAVYLLRKFIKRNAVLSAAGAMTAVALIAAIFGTSAGMMQAKHALSEVERQTNIAERVNQFLNEDLLGQANPSMNPDRQMTIEEALNAAAIRVQGRFDDEPLIEAAIHETLGHAYYTLGRYQASFDHWSSSYHLRRSSLSPDDPNLYRTLSNLANAALGCERYGDAIDFAREALEHQQRLLGEDHSDTVHSMWRLARAYTMLGRYADAEQLYVRGLEIAEHALEPDDSATLSCLALLGEIRRFQRRFDEAEELLTGAVAGWRRKSAESHPAALIAIRKLANLFVAQGRYDEAEPLLTELLEARRRVLGHDHDQTAMALHSLSMLRRAQGRMADAEPLLLEALDIFRRTVGEENVNVLAVMHELGLTLTELGRYDEAVGYLAQAVETAERALPERDLRRGLYHHAFGQSLLEAKRLDEADVQLQRAQEIFEHILGPDHRLTQSAMSDRSRLNERRAEVKQRDEY